MAKKTTKKAAKKTTKKTAKKAAKKTLKKAGKKTTKKAYGTRSDLNQPVDDYFENIDDDTLRAAAEALRALIKKSAPKAEPAIKWGIPTWMDPVFLCSIRASKKHVTLQFFDAGTSIEDPKGLLEGTGKNCRHVKATNAKDIDKPAVSALIKQAYKFNRQFD